jgi:prevent-host-death family protein
MATRIDLVEDVLPISELRLRAAQQIDKIQETQRPLIITQYGKAVAVLMEVSQFQEWQDRLAALESRLATLEPQSVPPTPENKNGGTKKTTKSRRGKSAK